MNSDTKEWYHRGTTLFCTGRYAEAIEVFERALESDPGAKEALVALAAAVDRLGLFYEAVLCCERALEADNQFADAWFVKGVALFKLSQYHDAVGCFEAIVHKGPLPCRSMVHERQLSLPDRGTSGCHHAVMTRPWGSAKNTQKHFTTWQFP